MMRVNVQISDGVNCKIDHAVAGEKMQHVIQESNARVQVSDTGSIQVQLQFNLCFARFAVNLSGARHSTESTKSLAKPD
jgi:hypothetical protein